MWGCLIAVLAVFSPRLALFIIWVFTPYVSRAFHGGWFWPLVGLIFLPFTTMAYSFAFVPGVGVTGTRWIWVFLGVVVDIIWHGGGIHGARKDYSD